MSNPFESVPDVGSQAPLAQSAVPLDADFFSAPMNGDQAAPPPTAATPLPDGQEEDARIAWRAENAKALEAKEEEEKKENEAVKVKAKEWLQRFNEERSKRIETAKENNAAQEQAATKGPQGDTPWEKVNSMIDFTFKPPQETEGERERFKKLLFSAKDKNVPCTV